MRLPEVRCPFSRRALAVLVAWAAIGNVGCFTMFLDAIGVKIGVEQIEIQNSRGAVPLPSSYLQIKGKKKEPRSGFVRVAYRVFHTFDISVTAGFFDPRLIANADGQRGCMEIDEPPGPGELVFAALCADYSAGLGGFDVGFFHNLDGPPVVFGPSIFVPGTLVDLRIASDGAVLIFYARAFGDPAWTEIGQTAYTRNPGLLASVGATFLNKKGEFGFTNPSIVNGPRPTSAGPRGVDFDVFDLMMEADFWFFQACFLIETFQDVAARAALDNALTYMAMAQAAMQGASARGATVPPGDVGKAIKNIDKARKKAEKAQAKLDAGKTKPATKQINKALKKADKAAFPFRPYDNVI